MTTRKNISSDRDNFNNPVSDALGQPNFLADTAGPAETAGRLGAAPSPHTPPKPWQQLGAVTARVVSRYSADELENFAKHVDDRARFRPPECRNGESCWVLEGPPAMAKRRRCLGCGSNVINLRGGPRGPYTRYPSL